MRDGHGSIPGNVRVEITIDPSAGAAAAFRERSGADAKKVGGLRKALQFRAFLLYGDIGEQACDFRIGGEFRRKDDVASAALSL
jgi:hypothetical protein